MFGIVIVTPNASPYPYPYQIQVPSYKLSVALFSFANCSAHFIFVPDFLLSFFASRFSSLSSFFSLSSYLN
jgi:hypothetical protein